MRDIGKGRQYLSKAHVTTLQAHRIKISVFPRGHPWENGYAERFICTLKEEEVDLNDYQSITEARERIGHFITSVSSETPAFGLRVFDTYGISKTNLILTLRNCGLNKRMHFTVLFDKVPGVFDSVAKTRAPQTLHLLVRGYPTFLK